MSNPYSDVDNFVEVTKKIIESIQIEVQGLYQVDNAIEGILKDAFIGIIKRSKGER